MRLFTRPRAADQWWLPYATGAVLAATVLAVMVWQVVIRGPFIAADWRAHEVFTPQVPQGAGQVILDTLSRPGQRWLTLPLLLVAGAWVSWKQKRARPLLAVLAGLGTAYLVGKAVKDALSRTPPYRDIDILHGLGEAFPSGHAANAALTWALLSVLFFGVRGLYPDRRWLRRGLLISAGLVVLVGVIMVVMDYHWISDIPGGWTVGLLALMIAMLALGSPSERSTLDQSRRDGGQAVPTAGDAKPISGRTADGDQATDRVSQNRFRLGPP